MANIYTSMIAEEASKAGLDPRLALAVGAQESSFNPHLRAKTTSAYGLFGFTDDAWRDYGVDPRGLDVDNPQVQATLGVRRLKENQDSLSVSLGRTPEKHEVYMSHFFGLTGSRRVLASSDDTPTSSVVSSAALVANPWITEAGLDTTGKVKAWFRNKLDTRLAEVEPLMDPTAIMVPPAGVRVAGPLLTGEDVLNNTRVTDGEVDLSLRAARALNRTREDVGEEIAIAPGKNGAFDVDLSTMTPQARERFLLLAMKNGFQSFQFDADAPDKITIDPSSAGKLVLKNKGRNALKFDKDGNVTNFPKGHWAANAVRYFRRGTGPLPEAVAAAVDPKLQASATNPAAVPERLPGQRIVLPVVSGTDVAQADSRPSAPYTDDEIAAQEKAAEAREQSLWQTTKDAVSLDWSLANIDTETYQRDPAWAPTDTWIKEAMKGLPERYYDGILETVSEQHARDFAQRARDTLQLEQRLAEQGFTGVAARFTAAVLDPVAIAAAVGTEGIAAPFVLAARGTRAARAARSAAVGLVSGGAAVGSLALTRPGVESDEVLYAMAGGLALGGIFGAISRTATPAEVRRLSELAQESQENIAARALERIGPRQSAGAAVTPDAGRPLNLAASDALEEARLNPAAPTAFSESTDVAGFRVGPRYDAVGQTLSSTNPLAAKTMDGLAEDAVGRVGGARNTLSATEYQAWFHRRQMNAFYKAVTPRFNDFAKDIPKWALMRRAKAYEEFNLMVTKSLRDPNFMAPPQVKQAASEIADQFEDILRSAKEPGIDNGVVMPAVKGFQDIAFNREYVPRIWHGGKIGSLRREFGDETMEKFIAAAFRARNPNFGSNVQETFEQTERFGRLFWHRLREHQVGHSSDLGRALSGEDLDALRTQLIQGLDEVGTEFTEAQVDDIINKLRIADTGGYARAKQRALLDENFSARLVTKDGLSREVRLDDLLENNIEQLFGAYSRNLSGAVALARQGYASVEHFSRRLRHIKQSADEVKGYTEAQLERDIKNLEYVGTMITGSPIGKFGQELFAARSSPFGQLARTIRDVNFVRLMGQLGFAQAAETMSIVGHVGFRTALAGMPELRALRRNMITGEIDDDFARELEIEFGFGTDRLRNSAEFRQEDFGSYLDEFEGLNQSTIRSLLERGKIGVMEASGAAAMNTFLQRWSMRAAAQKFADNAYGIRGGWSKQRLAAYGLDLEDAEKVSAEIRKHAARQDGALSASKLTKLNMEKWEPEVRDLFQQVMHRVSRHMVQENDPGNLAAFMSRPTAQLIFQFRNFVLVAHSKQLLHGLHMRDSYTTATFLGTMASAGMVYMVQRYAQAIGREDREAWLDEQLQPERIAAAAFSRAGWSALLPVAVDNVTGPLGAGPVFGTRTSGLNASGFLQNPTLDFLDSMTGALTAPARAALRSDYDYSQKDFKNLYHLLPFQNVIGVSNGLNALANGLPESGRN